MGFFRFIIFKSNGPHCNKKKTLFSQDNNPALTKAKPKLKQTIKS